ncbi:protein spinster homolog 1-like isoform X2 [Lineus longissimus]|uniref:protein spinster homolog 1-like isoform X2 n=1 Tax=Lineus longissimus TaxID=88925 RepID=UPI002B4ECEE1
MVQTHTSAKLFPIHDSVHLEDMSSSLEHDSLVDEGDDPMENGMNGGPRTRRRTTSGNHFHTPDPTVQINNPSINGVGEEPEEEDEKVVEKRNRKTSPKPSCRAYITVSILLFINLLNYMDRFTIAGVLKQVQDYYNIDNATAGLLQTAFICSYMILSPIFGYLGDRYNRKIIMCFGIFFWSAVTLAGSFIPADHFWAFILLRGCVGVGEASYSTIAPTLIADLFVKEMRTKMLAVFYFAIPVGSGLGYIVGSNVADAAGSWHWALRVTPGAGLVCCVLIIFVVYEPARGESEGGVHLTPTSWFVDVKQLCKNKSFMLSTFGFTCVAFTTGALAFWAPLFMENSITVLTGEQADAPQVALIFGVVTCLAGFIGVGLGAESARRLRRLNPRADPLVCAFGMLACTPFLFFALVMSKYNTIATWCLIFIGETLLCLNWSIVADMLLYVVIPTRRSTAEAFQILVSHALGDAGSPYVIGVISDMLKAQHDTVTAYTDYVSLQYALYSTAFICVLGGAGFLATALFIQRDKHKAEMIIKGRDPGQPHIICDGSSDESLLNHGEISVIGTQSTLIEGPTISDPVA